MLVKTGNFKHVEIIEEAISPLSDKYPLSQFIDIADFPLVLKKSMYVL